MKILLNSSKLSTTYKVSYLLSNRFQIHINFLEKLCLLTSIFLFATVLPALIRFLSLPRLMQLLTPKHNKIHKNLELQKLRIVKFTDYILNRNFLIWKKTCLKRSLILYHFLRKLGLNIQICFGVRYKKHYTYDLAEKDIEGHAWLLWNDEIFLEDDIKAVKTYIVTYCYPDAQQRLTFNNLHVIF